MASKTIINAKRDRTEGTFTKIVLRRFKSFAFQSVPVAPITILVGPNNSGKSAVLSSLRILQQTLQGVDPSVPLALGEFGTYKDIVHGNKQTDSVGFTIGGRYGGKDHSFEVNFAHRAQRRQVVQKDFKLFDEPSAPLLQTKYSTDKEHQILQPIGKLTANQASKLKLSFFHFTPQLNLLHLKLLEHQIEKGEAARLHDADVALATQVRNLMGLQYLGPNRDAPLRVFSFSGERPSILSPTGGGATDILVADYVRRGTGKRKLAQSVENWLAQAKIANQLRIDSISDRHYEIKFQHPVTGEFENYADVGFGISQILPVIVAGYNLAPGSLLIVEQPEIHLHPSAQSELGDFLLHLYERGVQTIVETHSEHLILRLQRYVGLGKIPPEDVAINYVYASEGEKVITRLKMNEDGIFTDTWPQGFFEKRLDEALELARAPLKRMGKL